ncbi:MAG: PBSX family phage terminase large subunit, partial [Gammaproteobacteria bacterium]|nr:PBSX family phage terminase large subunit [Gammaproteobacteria bacterium]
MMTEYFNIMPFLNPNHSELFKSTDFELTVRGGANAGKTYSIADKLLMQPIIQDAPLKALIVRKTLPRLRTSTLEVIEKRAKLFKLPFELNQANWVANIGNLKMQFLSLNNKEDYEKIRSLTDIDFIWCNELPELLETDYELLRTRIRGGKSSFAQFITDFNPIGKGTWVFKRFFEKNIGNVRKLRYTILDNPWATKAEVERLKDTKDHNPNFYKVYFEGEWGELEGLIFDWDIVCKTREQEIAGKSWKDIINPDEIFYGGDFGYSVDPAALIRIYRKANEFWVEQVIYEKGLTNIQLGKKMHDAGLDDKVPNYWDCAEPKSIQELYDFPFNAKPCEKGPDSIRAGIDFLKEQKIHILD